MCGSHRAVQRGALCTKGWPGCCYLCMDHVRLGPSLSGPVGCSWISWAVWEGKEQTVIPFQPAVVLEGVSLLKQTGEAVLLPCPALVQAAGLPHTPCPRQLLGWVTEPCEGTGICNNPQQHQATSCAALGPFLSGMLPGKKQLLITKLFQRWTGLQK